MFATMQTRNCYYRENVLHYGQQQLTPPKKRATPYITARLQAAVLSGSSRTVARVCRPFPATKWFILPLRGDNRGRGLSPGNFYRAALNAGRSSQEKADCLSVCQTRGLCVTKCKKNLSRFLHRTKDHSA